MIGKMKKISFFDLVNSFCYDEKSGRYKSSFGMSVEHKMFYDKRFMLELWENLTNWYDRKQAEAERVGR